MKMLTCLKADSFIWEAAAMALGKVFSFGPTLRAEKSKTRRHLDDRAGNGFLRIRG